MVKRGLAGVYVGEIGGVVEQGGIGGVSSAIRNLRYHGRQTINGDIPGR